MSTAIDVVEAMIRAIEDGDLDGVKLCYSPDVVVWANFDGRARDLESSLRVLAWMLENTSERRYEIQRRIEIEGGVLQQHVLHGTAAGTGKTFSMPACLVVSVHGGRINHIDEYLDPSVLQPAFAE
jgi:ketosteroid isomerase-like protein